MKNEQKCVPHVQHESNMPHDYFFSLNQSYSRFVAFLLAVVVAYFF